MHAFTLSVLALALGGPVQQADSIPLYDDLGDHHHAITTTAPKAQQYFDQGLRLVYGFNHAEAIASFREALKYDASCAMCYWGIAFAYGPNINLPMDEPSGAAAWEALQRAVELASKTSEVEQAFIGALAKRYGSDPAADRAQRDSAYARAMAEVAKRFPGDDDANVLYADALMNLKPWVYWTKDGKAREDTPAMLAALETVTARNPKHAGACHLFIHAVEEHYPERAEPCADRLAGLMPGAGHIVHMPGHIYIRVGRYADAIRANQHAIHEDESFIADREPEGVYPLGYYPHNYHFLNFAAMMAADREVTMQSARDLARLATPELMRTPGIGGFEQHYWATPLLANIRFEEWDAILAAPGPDDDLAYATGLWRYARGIAYARTGDAQRAAAELTALESAAATPGLDQLYILSYNNGATILAIASATLAGEVAAARKDWDQALAHLAKAVQIEDELIYIEPPEWPIPPRQHLARVQMLADRFADAQATFERDLARFKENVWSLRGLADSLERQGRTAEAADVRLRAERARSGSAPASTHSH